MTKKALILGAGRQALACAWWLRTKYDFEITMIDSQKQNLEEAETLFFEKPLKTEQISLPHSIRTKTLISSADIVISCLPYFLNLDLLGQCLEEHTSFLDLGGSVETLQSQLELKDEFTRRGITCILDCGVAPGAVNVLAELFSKDLTYESVEILCGGLPQKPTNSLKYEALFSVHGLLNEYLSPCEILKDGQVTSIPGLSELETVSVNDIVFEAFATSGGASLAPAIHKERGTVSYIYKTLRYPGHCAVIKGIKDMGLFTEGHARDFNVEIMERNLTSSRKDFMLAEILIQGKDKNNKIVRKQIQLYDKSNELFTAMERTTGFSLGVCAAYVAGCYEEKPKPGIFVPFMCLPPELLIKELREEDIDISIGEF